MINDVLNVSKLNLYDQFDEEEFDIKEIVAGVLKRRKPYAESHLIKLKLADERKEKLKLNGDKFLLDIAISNLVGNSIKYGIDSGNVEVTIKNDRSDVLIEVCDDGVGIPVNDIPKIFNDFYRASNVKKIVADGSGLGLSVVKKIIERHGGTITVNSPSRMISKNRPGTCFIIKLPFRRKEKDEAQDEFKANA